MTSPIIETNIERIISEHTPQEIDLLFEAILRKLTELQELQTRRAKLIRILDAAGIAHEFSTSISSPDREAGLKVSHSLSYSLNNHPSFRSIVACTDAPICSDDGDDSGEGVSQTPKVIPIRPELSHQGNRGSED